jgi:hypothetical protein
MDRKGRKDLVPVEDLAGLVAQHAAVAVPIMRNTQAGAA